MGKAHLKVHLEERTLHNRTWKRDRWDLLGGGVRGHFSRSSGPETFQVLLRL